ncbi:MAG: M1 family peptidase [Gemmatimonadales bacterium]|nr:MAG: M1 family peptidase [Gemmatimonadales bacterium]
MNIAVMMKRPIRPLFCGLAVGALLFGAPRVIQAQDSSTPAAGDGLIFDAPVFAAVQAPGGYARAIEAGTRSTDGRPGPNYWEQRVDYAIDVELDPATALVRGSETITIHNGSPNAIPVIALRLYQNVFAEGVERNRTVELTGGMELTRLVVAGTELKQVSQQNFNREPGYLLLSTLTAVRLPVPLAAGAELELEVDWSFVVSGGGGFRNGHLNNEVFNIAQWYPQVAVYDDVFGLDIEPYLGDGEFYVDYGDFDVAITVPSQWVVVGTGTLMNPDEVLRPEQVALLASAPALDTVVKIVSPEDIAAGTVTQDQEGRRLTWQFHADNVRDFAFAASNKYAWDATGAETGGPQGRALIQGVYDPAVAAWAEAAPFGKHAIEFYSNYLYAYPYPTATVAYGPPQVNGMEYPMITFISPVSDPVGLNGVTTHELSHFWVPMIVGTKENAYAWMDEGFTTYNTSLAMDDYYGDDPERRRGRDGAMGGYLQAARAEVEVPIMWHTDFAPNGFGRSIAAYSKPGMLMHALRHMMGEDEFDAAYRDYIDTWAFKHPMPWDFFAMMEEAAGTDLDWFWQSWYYETGTLDQAVVAVTDVEGGAEVTVSNNRGGVMPVELHLELENGTTIVDVWPAGVWAGTREVTRLVLTDSQVRKVSIDPDTWYPDIDRSNNDWERPGA